MTNDIVLRCAPRSWPRNGIGLAIIEPAKTGARNGFLQDPPEAWSVGRGYYAGESEVQPLIDWLHDSLGDELLRTISTLAANGPARLLISDENAATALFSTPWEVLETSTPDHYMDNVRVVRSLPLPSRSGGADDIGVSLRVFATWANPSNDIPAIGEHVLWLNALPETTDNAVAIKVFEFTDVDAVRHAMSEFRPNVVYHFGHADAIANNKVALRIGKSGGPHHLDGALYAELLQPFSPRILVLNACSTITGRSLSPYIGLSSECMAACESVVCMQTEVSVGAARRFGRAVLQELADNAPLSHAVRQGRRAMVEERVPPFTRFVPVLLTRGRADPAFAVNTDERTRMRVQKRLEADLQKVEPLLAREADSRVDALLAEATGVALITGPASSGKSTTIRGRIAVLLSRDATARPLYRSVKDTTWVTDPALRVQQLVSILVSHFQWLTQSLASVLREQSDTDARHVVAELAAWLKERSELGRRTVVIVDDLPEDVASELVRIAANVVMDGLLVVVARDARVDPQAGVHALTIPFMSEVEISTALSGTRFDTADVLTRTGGMPFYVASIMTGQPLDGSRLDARIRVAPESAKHVLRLAAYATGALPRAWLESVGDVAPLAADHLLIESQSGDRLTLPAVVRDRVRETLAGDELALRSELFAYFNAYGARHEAMEQALALALQTRDAEWLDRARDFAFDLHDVTMHQAGDAIAARAVWDAYREVAHELGEFVDREVEARFAEVLAGIGAVSLADEVLDNSIALGELDDLQVRMLILRSNLLKRLGGSVVFEERVRLLQEAEALAERLVAENPGDHELLEMLGNVEQSLGNAFGYGKQARIPDAERHVKRAAEIFDQLGDLRAHRARAELIEIRRYNGLLSDTERLEAIATIHRQRVELITPSMRRDQIFHLYELGRLATDPESRAKWFRRACERAAGSFSPLDLHAAVQWRMAELELGMNVETELAEVAAKLERFADDSWSLRLRRDASRALAERAFGRADTTAGVERLRAALAISRLLAEKGEGRHDSEIRLALEEEGGRHGLRG